MHLHNYRYFYFYASFPPGSLDQYRSLSIKMVIFGFPVPNVGKRTSKRVSSSTAYFSRAVPTGASPYWWNNMIIMAQRIIIVMYFILTISMHIYLLHLQELKL